MAHASDRVTERLAQVHIDPQVILSAAQRIADADADHDLAVLMLQLPITWGDTDRDILARESNGNQVWAVLRHGQVCTVMLRREHQPSDRAAFGVDKVLRIRGAVIAPKTPR